MKIAIAGATGRVGHYLVDVLKVQGHDIVAMSRSTGVDVITGDGLAQALTGVDTLIDVSSGPSPEQQAAAEFFSTATRNLQAVGKQAGVRRMIVISIIGIDRFLGGYMAAKLTHEKVALAGPIPTRILRAAQFHEFVAQMVQWGTNGNVAFVPKMRTQLVSAKAVAEVLAAMAIHSGSELQPGYPIPEVAGPRAETLADAAAKLVARRGDQLRIEEVSNPADPDSALYESGALLPGSHATLAGPTFDEWLTSAV